MFALVCEKAYNSDDHCRRIVSRGWLKRGIKNLCIIQFVYLQSHYFKNSSGLAESSEFFLRISIFRVYSVFA